MVSGAFYILGVADGVGGWEKKGMNGGEYEGELMANSVLSMKYQPKGQIDPMIVLNQAFLNTEARGSSTACILTLTGNMLHAANIGDSGFVL
ncbi:probable protein phosphatase 2C 55 [Actinidia eriantha]|uniref:probable protein phosphatase 2C 55 n=1 Tax=Actinidia eriantha TaxID=165200 RepID=UPI00258628D2|nr:probable protein phosphatase 2C 55 [Actinidia eriantha]